MGKTVVGVCGDCGAETEALPTTPQLQEGVLHEPDRFSLGQYRDPSTGRECLEGLGGWLNIPTSIRLADSPTAS